MRLLIVTTLYPNSAEPNRATFNRNRAKAIAEAGHEVAVVAPLVTFPGAPWVGLAPRVAKQEEIDGIQVWHPSFHRTPLVFRHYHHVMYRATVGKALKKVVDAWRPDHILIMFAYPDGAAIAPLCQAWGIPWSLAVLGSDFYLRRWQTRFRETLFRVLREAPLIFCPGQALKQALVESGLHPEKLVAFFNGVDRQLFQLCEEPRQPVVLFVGNWLEVKGIDRLIGAWPLLRRPDLKLRLVGAGQMEGALRQQCRDLKIDHQVQFVGPLAPQEVAREMQQAQLLCLPSRSEGMPNVVLEALACGTPVVGSEAGEIPFLVRDGENGFTFPNDDDVTEAVASALRQALSTEWDAAAVAASVADYSWQRTARTIMQPLVEQATS